MPKVVFYYFPFKALGESIRLLLAYGGQEFEDVRITKEEWPEYQSRMPFGKMPVLEIDGKQYAQSVATARYLGRKYGLCGADIEEDFQIDEIVDYFNDVRAKAGTVHYEGNAELKAKLHEDFTKNVYPERLAILDEAMKKNNGYLAAGKLTWADFYFTGLYEYIKMMVQDDLDKKYPRFKKLQDAVLSLPKVKEWVAAAPKSDF